MGSNTLFPFQQPPDDTSSLPGWLRLITRRFAADSTGAVKSAAFTPDAEVEWYRVSASGGAVTVTVPLAASNPYRRIGFIKTDSSTNAVTPTRSGSDTINSATTFALSSQYAFVILKSDGISAWDVAGRSYSANGDVIFSDAPNSDTAVNSITPVTIISKSVTGIAAGDQIEMEVWFTILNNSGANRTYTFTGNLGTLTVPSASPSISAHASQRLEGHVTINFSVSATNLAKANNEALTMSDIVAANTVNSFTNGNCLGWNTTTNDITGTQTLTFTVTSTNATATQTFTMNSYKIRKNSTL